MRKIDGIISLRKIIQAPSYQIMFEWEDIIANEFPLKLYVDKSWYHKIYRRFDNNNLTWLYYKYLSKQNLKLRFVMEANTKQRCVLNKNTLPVIIDFWLNKNDLPQFYQAYRECSLVLITSAEVYEFLKLNDCPLKIAHWPLSFPDKYAITLKDNYVKRFDLCFIGRPNPYFKVMLDRYVKENPTFEYVYNNGDINNRMYYTNKGEFIMKDTGRASYINIIQQSKITFYSTPGIDLAKKETNVFNQVTPRFFEMLAGGCYILGHYPDNADTRYYKLSEMMPNIKNYDEFKHWMNLYRSMPPRPMDKCADYLRGHYTSTRVAMLRQILMDNNIEL